MKPRTKSAPTVVVLHEQARAIIGQLQEDGRRPFTRMAKEVGPSEAAVRQRVRQLEDAGISLIGAVTPGVRTTETFIYMSLWKQTYTWGAH